jgi:hypothetical protein
MAELPIICITESIATIPHKIILDSQMTRSCSIPPPHYPHPAPLISSLFLFASHRKSILNILEKVEGFMEKQSMNAAGCSISLEHHPPVILPIFPFLHVQAYLSDEDEA